MSNFDNTDRSAYMTLGALFGIAGGVAIGMLMAPRSGVESREQLRQKAQEARQKAMDAREKAMQQVHEKKDAVVENLAKGADKGADMAEKAQQKARAKSGEIKNDQS